MIRINLLPSDKKKRARRIAPSPLPGGDFGLRTWGAIYAGAIATWLVVLGILYFVQSGELETIAQENKTLEARRDELQSKTKGLGDVEARLEKSRRLEKVVQELERARRGPTRAVMELSKVLSITPIALVSITPGNNIESLIEFLMREELPVARLIDPVEIGRQKQRHEQKRFAYPFYVHRIMLESSRDI